jgi:hypothetical protein
MINDPITMPTIRCSFISNPLIEEFTATRMNEFPLLASAQSSMEKDVFRSYINKVINIASRSISKAP